MATLTPGSVNFGTIVAPDVAAEQMALARRQQMVDLLRQQAVTPIQQQTAGGMAVPISPMEGIAKLAAGYLSGSRQKDIDAKTLDLNKQMADRYSQILGGGAPASVAAPVAMAQGASQGSVGPTVANAARMDTMTTPPKSAQGGNNFDMARLLRGSLVEQLGGAPAAAAYWDDLKTPEQLKIADTLGVSRTDLAAALRRETAAKGQTMVREGSTITQTQPDGSVVPMFTAPDMKQGANITWQGGAPQAAPIQGLSAINAGMAGAQTAATEDAKAARDMVTVNTPQGPKMMTRAQAVELAGGGAPAAGGAPIAPPATPQPQPMAPQPATPRPTAGNPPPGSGVVPPESPQDRMGVLQQQLVKTQQAIANPSVNDADRQRLQNDERDIQSEIARMGTSNGKPNGLAPQGGIPLQTEGQQKFEQTMGTEQAQILSKGFDAAKTAADDILGIGQSRVALKSGAFTGPGADMKLTLTKFINANVPGVVIAPDKAANTDYLKSQLGQGLLEKAKTLGSNPSNADAARINDIVGSIGKDPNALAKILDWRQQMAERAIQMHNGRVGQAIKNGFTPQFDMTVKSPVNTNEIDSLLKKYGGR